MLVAPALFASNMLVARAVAGTIPPVALAFWRWAATLLLLALLFGRPIWRQRHVLRREWAELLLLGALGMGVCGAFVYIAAATTTATNIGILYAASPVLIILLGRLLHREHMARHQLLGVALCLAGVLVILARADLAVLLGLRFTVGDLWVVAAVVAWAVYSVRLRYRPTALGLNERFTGIVLGGLVALLPFTIAEALLDRPPALAVETVAWVAFLAVVASFGAYQVYGMILQALGASEASLLFYLTPVYNALLAWLLLGERLAPYHLAGAALVLPGLYLATRRRPLQRP
jgi:drug/metabolite transporter (DMT)-like permease